jgi:hypothetical protein
MVGCTRGISRGTQLHVQAPAFIGEPHEAAYALQRGSSFGFGGFFGAPAAPGPGFGMAPAPALQPVQDGVQSSPLSDCTLSFNTLVWTLMCSAHVSIVQIISRGITTCTQGSWFLIADMSTFIHLQSAALVVQAVTACRRCESTVATVMSCLPAANGMTALLPVHEAAGGDGVAGFMHNSVNGGGPFQPQHNTMLPDGHGFGHPHQQQRHQVPQQNPDDAPRDPRRHAEPQHMEQPGQPSLAVLVGGQLADWQPPPFGASTGPLGPMRRAGSAHQGDGQQQPGADLRSISPLLPGAQLPGFLPHVR